LRQDTTNCGQNHCGACCSGGCTGCGGALELTQGELDLLWRFAEIPFLPVARRWDSETPIYLEDCTTSVDEMSKIITALQQKQLIRLDYDLPLSGFDYEAYGNWPAQGSMALTARGQQVIEQLEIQGIEES
jgi:hypothetical protein